MEETLDKLFTLLEEKKNESLFKLIISQIVQINKQYPNNTSSRVFEKIIKMAESNVWETRLVAASLVDKIYDNHLLILDSFLKNEQAQIDSLNGILVYEPYVGSLDSAEGANTKLTTLHEIQKREFLDANHIDFEVLVERGPALYACALDTMEDVAGNDQREKEIMNKISGNMDDDRFFFNYLEFLNSLDNYAEKDGQDTTSESTQTSATALDNGNQENGSSATKKGRGRGASSTASKAGSKSADKKGKQQKDMPAPSKKVKLDEIMQNQKTLRLKACSLINVVHRYACQNIFDSKWEKRHGSSLLLKSLIKADSRLLLLNLEVDKAVFADSTTVVKVIKERVMEETTSTKIYQDILARSLIILALDRFSDFVSDKAHIVVRETCCQIVTRLMSPDVYSAGLEERLLVANRSLLNRKEWEVRIGVLTCLQSLLADNKDRFADKILEYFWNSFRAIVLAQDENDEIIHVFAECFQYLISPKLFQLHIEKVQIIAMNLWSVILRLDDITYATSALTNLLRRIHEEAPSINDIYPEGFNMEQNFDILLILFHHNIQEVRHNNYILIHKLLALLSYNKKEIETLKKLLIGVSQNLLVETDSTIIHILQSIYRTVVPKTWEIDSAFVKSHLQGVFSTSMTFNARAIVDSFKSFHIVSHFPSYSFVEVPQEPYNLENLMFQRLNKLFGALFECFLHKEALAQFFIEDIIRPNLELNHLYVYCYLFFIGQLHFNAPEFPEQASALFKKYYDEKLVMKVLNWSYFHAKRPDLQHLASEIQNSINNVTGHLSAKKVPVADDFLSKFPRGQNIDADKLEGLYNEAKILYEKVKTVDNIKNVVVLLESSIYLINAYVLRSNDFLCLMKSFAAGAYILQSKLKGEIDKLNLVIKPVMQMINKSQSVLVSQHLAFFILSLVQLVQHKTPNPVSKVLKNMLNLFGSESDTTSQLNFINYKDEFKLSTHIKPIEYLVTSLIKEHGTKFIEKFPEFRESILSELLPFLSAHTSKTALVYDKTKVYRSLKIVKRLREPLLSPELETFRIEVIKGSCAVFNGFQGIDQDRFKVEKKDEFNLLKNVLTKIAKLLRKNSLWHEINILFAEINIYVEEHPSPAALLFLEEFFHGLARDFVEYAKIFIIPAIKYFTVDDKFLRLSAQRCFSSLVKCSWIEVPDMVKLLAQAPALKEKYDEGNFFLKSLTHKTSSDVKLKTKINAKLRSYQLEGVSWMNFLFSFNLNGALCDDMGLGKTLQTLVVVQELIHEVFWAQKNIKKHSNRSIIIVPSSLIDHWLFEIKRYCDSDLVRGFAHTTFQKNEENFSNGFNVLVISYQSFVKNFEQFQKIKFFFAILDEAHLVKNPKTKFSKSIKSLKSTHKLVLTGTPIQNNIVELWNIFDFLMPGYLGTEESFRESFSKYFHTNLLKFKDIDLEFSTLQDDILADLHRKVMPFIMRRDKMTVLSELPPKIIQDHYCSLTSIQEHFYKDFERSEVGMCETELAVTVSDTASVSTAPSTDGIKKVGKNVLKMLSTLRKICNHPYMLVKSNEFKIPSDIKSADLQSYEASGKLLALRDLFHQFGFGDEEVANPGAELLETKNKVILFTKYTETLDIIVNLFLSKLFANLKYMRIDGTINSSKRFSIVNQFNNDPDCHLILVTTTVGGVGLNLSSANIVIMFDHDYNPMNDLQAIDRAHRIGQKNKLHVYRLITKNTLEEQIMGIQKFKLNVANAVINIENSSTENIKKSNLLSLFSGIKVDLETDKTKEEAAPKQYGDKYSKLLEGMDELWDEDQYSKEY